MWNRRQHLLRALPDAHRAAPSRRSSSRAPRSCKRGYLPKLVSGEWTGTMVLTEPQAGSDLSAVRTRAVPQADGTYRLEGQKIFITYGEHDLADEHRPPRARPHPGRARGREGHLALRRAQVPRQRRRQPRRAQRRPLRLARAQARHPRQPDRGAGVRRQGRRRRLAGRRGEPRPRVHVHHDERGAVLGRARGRRPRRARLPARRVAYARERIQGTELGTRSKEKVAIIRHPDVRRMLHADEVAHRGDARDRLRRRGGDGHRPLPPRRRPARPRARRSST